MKILYLLFVPSLFIQVIFNTKTKYFIQDEIEIEAKALRVGKAIAVVTVEFRNKKTGKIIAQGRHTKYLAVSSKLWADGIFSYRVFSVTFINQNDICYVLHDPTSSIEMKEQYWYTRFQIFKVSANDIL